MKKVQFVLSFILLSVAVNAQSDYSNVLKLSQRVPETEVKPIDNFVSKSDILAQGALNTYYNHQPDFKLEFKDPPNFSSGGFGFGFRTGPGITDFQNGIINGRQASIVNRMEDIREPIRSNTTNRRKKY
ncbi:hypothetical protein EDL98_00935 [Ornithobacterium rhinotracheale]|uniref:hypothetical protein n=1 Tax=Ornithobacterium rhinotracheale TaxID=28251 RepID=UPI00129C570A|nr:hypothetical protein [Ornithobacterium rhinotracheale]MRJ09657.1 hypothetical protein [Ornithobacterium rhinotracheale]